MATLTQNADQEVLNFAFTGLTADTLYRIQASRDSTFPAGDTIETLVRTYGGTPELAEVFVNGLGVVVIGEDGPFTVGLDVSRADLQRRPHVWVSARALDPLTEVAITPDSTGNFTGLEDLGDTATLTFVVTLTHPVLGMRAWTLHVEGALEDLDQLPPTDPGTAPERPTDQDFPGGAPYVEFGVSPNPAITTDRPTLEWYTAGAQTVEVRGQRPETDTSYHQDPVATRFWYDDENPSHANFRVHSFPSRNPRFIAFTNLGAVVASNPTPWPAGRTLTINGETYTIPETRDADTPSDQVATFPLGLVGDSRGWQSVTGPAPGGIESVILSTEPRGTLALAQQEVGTYDYQLIATNNDGTTTRDVTLAVEASTTAEVVRIDSFRAARSVVAPGARPVLSWATTAPAGATVTLNGATVAADGRNVAQAAITSATTYTLRMASGGVVRTAIVRVRVQAAETETGADPPTLVATVSPSQVEEGGTATLRWTTSGATGVTVDGARVAVPSGARTVRPSESRSYRVVATGEGGTTTVNVQVVVIAAEEPPTATLSASSTTVAEGQSVALRYATNGATSASISGHGAVRLPSGSVTVRPTTTTTYTLTAANDGGTATSSVTVTVSAPRATISSFMGPSGDVEVGDTYRLSWVTRNATTVTLDGDPVAASGFRRVAASEAGATTHTLIAQGAGSADVERVTVTAVVPARLPTITHFTAPARLYVGRSFPVSWGTTGATNVTLNGAAVTANGTRRYAATRAGSFDYVLVATNDDGSVTRTVTVSVLAEPAPTLVLSQAPECPNGGVRWAATNVTHVDVHIAIPFNFDQRERSTLPSGTLCLRNRFIGPNVATVTAHGRDGTTVTRTLTIE